MAERKRFDELVDTITDPIFIFMMILMCGSSFIGSALALVIFWISR